MEREVKLFTEDTMKDMGKRIQDARKNKGFKAIDFADIIGIGKDQLSRVENGRVVCKLEYIYVIAQYLEISTDYLLYGKEKYIVSDELIATRNIEKKLQIIRLLNEL
ncbi:MULTISPECIES: helix-turn-helix domain-containing protein [unclassified Lacrimispora]|uniref:helix-turn-helix domain-containing protein n=1 Tax=unclassified Lacrimispora TaxID=2719232 RepID=UPI0037707216